MKEHIYKRDKGTMSNFKNMLSVSDKARNAWAKEKSALDEVNLAFELLELVLFECKSTTAFKDDIQRDTDFRACIGAIVRCAVHYYLHAQAGCFDDARVFERKAMEFIAVCIGIGYDDDLYQDWKNEEFTKPGRGCTYLCKSILKSPSVPDEEKAMAAGCSGYITKPIDTRAFPKDVSRFIDSAGVP